jgi:hypothetical protein
LYGAATRGWVIPLLLIAALVFSAERRLTSAGVFRFVGLATIFLTVVAGAVQATVDTGDFKTFWDGVWWAVVTVTTVGYGDIYPKTVAGRAVGMTLMLVGIGFLSVLTATIASRFVKQERSEETTGITDALARIEADLAAMRANSTRGKRLAHAQSPRVARSVRLARVPGPGLSGQTGATLSVCRRSAPRRVAPTRYSTSQATCRASADTTGARPARLASPAHRSS